MDSATLSQRLAELLLRRKALNVVIIDIRGRSGYADFLVIGSGTSDRHVQAVAEQAVQEIEREAGVGAIGLEGLRDGQWALADFGSVVVHVFHQFTRDVYDLDGLWRDAPRLQVDDAASKIA